MQADSTPAPGAAPPPPPADPAPTGADRRLYRRYPAGLPAEIAAASARVACSVSDISLGGVCAELVDGARPPPLGPAELRSPAMAGGYGFPVEVRKVLGARVHLAFALDDRADFELTMFLMDSPATLDALDAAG